MTEQSGIKKKAYFFSSCIAFQANQRAAAKKKRYVDSFRTSAENLRR
jgi:hypothetical protein